MKTWKKVCLCICALILIAGIGYVGYYVNEEKKIANYSTLCFDKAKEQVGEYLGNVTSFFQMKDDGEYFYYGSFSHEEVDYKYYCKVQDKDNVNLKLEVVSGNEEQIYNENSWKEIIDDDCMLFFDGCNDCSKDSDGTITCTAQECETYQKPVCTDDSGIVPEEAVHNEVIYDDYDQFLEMIKSSGEQPQGKKDLYEEVIEAIDTEEERKEGCKNEAMKLFNDMIPNGEFVNLVWEGLEEETREEGRLTIIQRNLRIIYNQDGKEWFWPGICETNFIEGNQKVLFSQSYMNI